MLMCQRIVFDPHLFLGNSAMNENRHTLGEDSVVMNVDPPSGDLGTVATIFPTMHVER